MKKSRLFLLLISIMLLCFTFGLFACTPVNPGDEEDGGDEPAKLFLSAVLMRGEVTIVGGEAECKYYKVYAAGELIAESDKNIINIIDGIKDTFGASECYGDYDIEVEGYNSNNELIKATENPIEFTIHALNSLNFKGTLESAYSSSDYFMLEEDIRLYGVYDSRVGNVIEAGVPTGYKTISMEYCPSQYGAGSIANAINRPLDAMIDGNGYTINYWVDERIPYQAGYVMGTGGLFNKVNETGGLCNMAINMDVLYCQAGGQYTGALIYREAQGVYENLFVSATLRPVTVYKEQHQWYNRDGDCPLVYEADKMASIIGNSYNSSFTECVFAMQILDHNGNPVVHKQEDLKGNLYVSGGVIGTMGYVEVNTVPVLLKNCVLIRDVDEPHFNNRTNLIVYYPTDDNGNYYYDENGDKIPGWIHSRYYAEGTNVYFYRTFEDFANGSNGYVRNGIFDKDNLTYEVATDSALDHLSVFTKQGNKVIFMDGTMLDIATFNTDNTETLLGWEG